MTRRQEVKETERTGGDKRKAGEDDDKRKTRETTQTLKEGLSLSRDSSSRSSLIPGCGEDDDEEEDITTRNLLSRETGVKFRQWNCRVRSLELTITHNCGEWNWTVQYGTW